MSDPFIGEIKIFAGNFAPRNYAFCDGQLLPISQNTALFSLFGTIYGGDGSTTFALPDMRGRMPVHPGNGPGLSSINIGAKGGGETHTLTAAEMPVHQHTLTNNLTLRGTTQGGVEDSPAGHLPAVEGEGVAMPYSSATADADLGSDSLAPTVANTGSGQSFNIRSPFTGIYFIVALQGIYPSRS